MPSWIAEIARAEGGRISFEQFMELALLHPTRGYYTRHISAVGALGDFATAVTIGDALIRSIANWIRVEARQIALPKLNIIEMGGGGGHLARGILHTFRTWDRVRYQIVETSQSLQKSQARELHGRKIRWQTTIEAALDAADGQAIVLANEFVDAFPCKRFERATEGWREIILSLEGNVWREQLDPGSSEMVESSTFSICCPIGQRVETHGSYRRWLENLTRHLVRGALLAIDYGGWPAEIYYRKPRGTVRAFFRHERLEGMQVYLRPGHQDLTADVNFLDLRNWGEALGLITVDFVNQAEFIRLWDHPRRKRHSPADTYLSDENAMGSAIKVLHQRKTTAPAQNVGRLIESYTARLSARDHFNSSGQRLREPAEIIRQDRANYYVYGVRDSEDQPDSFFSVKDNRARLEQLLANGRTTREAFNAIVNGTPLIRVDIYQNGVSVIILSE